MPTLEIKGFKKSFGKTEVLKGVNFSMEEGEVLSVIGSSGSGKTTLLRCINFLERADEGQIFLDGKLLFSGSDKTKPTAAEMRAKQLNFGLVFQDFNLFPQYDVLENVTLAPRLLAKEREDFKANKKEIYASIEEEARELLERVGLLEKLHSYPCQLSGGQKQRVAAARSLISDPDIILADEPTGNLDPENSWEIMKLLEEANDRGTTVLVVTHNQEIVNEMQKRVVTMKKGVIVSDEKKGGYKHEN